MKIIDLYRDYNLDYKTEGHKHCRPGWVNVECPFCSGNPGYHLGYNLHHNYFYCWRCGFHPVTKTISSLLNIPYLEARDIINQYGGKNEIIQKKIIKNDFKFPSNLLPYFLKTHKNYLHNRGFDPIYIEQFWGVKASGPVSMLGEHNYANRLIIPIEWEGEIVSFIARDFTSKTSYRYLVCPENYEKIHHKHILYGKQSHWLRFGICVEGVTDVWKIGPLSFATFGIEFTREQVRQMIKYFDTIVVMYDNEPQAEAKAQQLIAKLKFAGVNAFRYRVPTKDPGELTNLQAQKIVNKILNEYAGQLVI